MGEEEIGVGGMVVLCVSGVGCARSLATSFGGVWAWSSKVCGGRVWGGGISIGVLD